MKKTMLWMKPIVILALILSIGLTSCKKGWWGNEEGGGGTGNTGGGNTGLVKGTVVMQGCGLSIYGKNLWIKTDDGQLLQPCEQSFVTLCAINLKEGDRVEIKYHKYTGSLNGFEFYCKMAYFYFTRVTIDFLNIIQTNNNCSAVTIPKNYDLLNAAGVNIIDGKMVEGKLYLNIGFSGCDNSTKRFKLVAKEWPVAGPIPTFEVKIVEQDPQMCQAYFTKEVCFDVASLKNPLSSSYVIMHLVGSDKVFQF